MANHRRKGVSLALVAGSTLALLGAGTGTASAQYLSLGDAAVSRDAPNFRLNGRTLEPGCFMPGMGRMHNGAAIDSHIDVTERSQSAHISVDDDAQFAVDLALIPGVRGGYKVYTTFDTGSIDNDADIDSNQTATGLTAPGNDRIDKRGVIVCISDNTPEQNEPYIADGLPGEVAAINRPIIQPTLANLGVSAVTALKTYKIGFGYEVQRQYDPTWYRAFHNDGVWGLGDSLGDPQGRDLNGDLKFDRVWIKSRAEQPGVKRFNDMDESGEGFNRGPEKASYGQPIRFDVSGTGDPDAYLHKSLPGTVDGGDFFAPIASWLEGEADQTSASALLTFTAEGDLPVSWSVKPSLAPEAYGKSVTLTDDMLRQWHKDWQSFYAGKGPKPALPLAPGTKSPDPDPSITVIVNQQEERKGTEPQTPIVVVQQVPAAQVQPQPTIQGAAKATKPTVRAKLMRGKNGRYVQVHVRTDATKARVVVQLLNAKKRAVSTTMKTVSTNKDVRIKGLKVGKQVKSVKATVAG